MIPRSLDPKKEQLLKVVVKEYIHTASPVASLVLGSHYGLESSSATLRNWMSDLENLGFLRQPHPSSGRIPTDQGYRHYVNMLMEKEHLSAKEKRLIRKELEAGFHEIEDLIQEAAAILSQVGHCAALVLAPADENLLLESIQLVRVGKEKVLFVLLTQTGFVFDRIVEMEIGKERLEVLSRILNKKLNGIPLSLIGPQLLEGIADEMSVVLLSKILELIAETVEKENKNRVVVEGTHHLLDQPEFRDIVKFKNTLEILKKDNRLSKFLGGMSAQSEVSIRIGYENPIKHFQEMSVITAPFGARNHYLGTLALVGPTRMDYDRLIPLIQYTASVVSERLNNFFS